MTQPRAFTFGDNSVASAYDDVLVPALFRPWAVRLVEEHPQWWEGRCVLDLATGTGVVAQLLADQVGPEGRVIGTDINGEMLSIASDAISSWAIPPAVRLTRSSCTLHTG